MKYDLSRPDLDSSVNLILCPICKGFGSNGSKINELGNWECAICDKCGGIGWLNNEYVDEGELNEENEKNCF